LAQYEHLPVYTAAFDLLVYFEKIVKNFSHFNLCVCWKCNTAVWILLLYSVLSNANFPIFM